MVNTVVVQVHYAAPKNHLQLQVIFLLHKKESAVALSLN